MKFQIHYRQLLRSLLLPLSQKNETLYIEFIKSFLIDKIGSEETDHLVWLNQQIEKWEDVGNPSEKFGNLVRSLLSMDSTEYSEVISENYFKIHNALLSKELIDYNSSRIFLSHLLFICKLANEERMSSAQIASILQPINPVVGFSRRSIGTVLAKLQMKPKISVDEIENLFIGDKSFESYGFGDSDIMVCIEMVSDIAKKIGLSIDIERQLTILAPINDEDLGKYTPYLQILHYQCSILEFYDHTTKDFYEFAPRGVAGKRLFDKYPKSMANAGNPFLNNAKSVAIANLPWALSKKNNELPGATALFYILEGLDSLGYTARQELALWIRGLLHRIIVLAEPLDISISKGLKDNDYRNLVENIAKENTKTRGIIEQRFVVSVTQIFHPISDGWKSRGIGDSVNASNLSSKKLGDCDFQLSKDNRVVAYEAHGGVLTESYMEDHIATLPKILAPRINEWSTFSSPDDWNVLIIFVAHEIKCKTPKEIVIDGVTIKIELWLYNEIIKKINFNELIPYIEKYLIGPISDRKTPSFVRKKINEFIE